MKSKIFFISSIFLLGISLVLFTFNKQVVISGEKNIEKFNLKQSKINLSSKKTFQNYSCIKSGSGVKIYAYIFHYIIPDKFVNPKNKIEYGNSLSPEFFEKVITAFNKQRQEKNIEIINFSDFEKFYKTDCYPNKNIVILTADDGWDDNYNYLFPIIKKYNIPFNLALISSKISKVSAEINNFANEYEIKEMLDSGLVEIASHTVNHFDLRRLDFPKKEFEICESKKQLENLFKIRINSLVYPSGKYDSDSEKIIKKCGYSFGFTVDNKSFVASNIDKTPFEITRIRINRKTNIDKIFDFLK